MQQYRTMKPEKIFIPIVIAFLLIIVAVFCLAEPFNKIQSSQKEKVTVQNSEKDLKRQIDAMEEEKSQEQENLRSLKEFYTMSGSFSDDSLASFGGMLDDVIENFVKPNGVMVRSIDYKIDPAEDPISTEFAPEYHSCAIDLKLICKYEQLQKFLGNLINDFPYFIRISQIIVTAYPPDKEYLDVTLTIDLYVKNQG